LYYEYSRWYDPGIGRFISQDPSAGHVSDPQSLNPYIYVENLPTVLTDPTGAVLCDGNQDCEGGGLLPVQPLTQEQLNSIEDPQIREICGDNPLICRAMGYIQDDQVGGSISTSGGLKAGGPLDPTPTITTTGSQDTSVFYRYITTSELQDLQENPVLSPGESGRAYFTTDVYDSQSVSYNRLSLYEQKDYRIAFRFTDNPDITGPRRVGPTYFTGTDIIRTNGGGREYFIKEIARITLIGDPVPLGP